MKFWRKCTLILFTIVSVSFIPKVEAFSGGGTGISGDPYQITTCAQITEISNSLSSWYLLKNDLDCTSTGNNIIVGAISYPFTGNFNGGGYTITVNISVNSPFVGLFVKTNNATISDVRIAGNVSGTGTVGGLIAQAEGTTHISRVVNTANVFPYGTNMFQFVFAGIAGRTEGNGVIIEDSYNTGEIGKGPMVTTYSFAAGIVADGRNATIRRVYNIGRINSLLGPAGGIVAQLDATGVITDSFNTGIAANTAGIIGAAFATAEYTYSTVIQNNYFDESRTMNTVCMGSNSYTLNPVEVGACESRNTNWANNNYFKNNSTANPFQDQGSVQKWDFTSVWETVPDGYPALRSIFNDEIARTSDFAQPPPAPFDLFVSNRGAGTADITWKHTQNEYANTSFFHVEYKKTSDTTWTVLDTQTVSLFNIDIPKVTLTGLEQTAYYNVRINGFNTVGGGDYSGEIRFSPGVPGVKASAPQNITVTATGDPLIVNADWDAPENAGDYPITGYVLESKYSTSSWDDLVFSHSFDGVTTSELNISGLKNSHTYNFRVYAITAEGAGASSSVVEYTTPLSTTHYIKNCTDSTDEDNFGLQGIDNNTAYRDDVFYLANSIDCTGEAFVPLMYTSGEEGFEGVFDGQNYSIQHLNIPVMNSEGNGLFYSLHAATIRNFALDITMIDLLDYRGDVGGIAGTSYGYTNIDHVQVTINLSVYDGDYLGGIIGEAYSMNDADSTISISNSSVNGQIINDSGDSGGGLIGMVTCDNTASDRYCSVIQNNTVNATIHTSEWSGGIIGYYYITGSKGILVTGNTFSGTITLVGSDWNGRSHGGIIGNLWIYTTTSRNIIANNTSSGTLTVGDNGGGIVGNYGNYTDAAGMVFDNNHSSMTITGEDSIGGLIGFFENDNWSPLPIPEIVSNSSFTGTVTSSDDYYGTGGLIGEMYAYNFLIQKCFTTGTVSGGEYIGGLIGYSEGNIIIDDSYSLANVTGKWSGVGGMIGYAYADDNDAPILIRNSYAAGNISGEDQVGGITGYNGWMLGIENTFFDGTVTATATEPSQTGSIIGLSDDETYSFENVSYNKAKTDPLPCVGEAYEPSEFESCLGVNTDNATPNFFKGTISVSPISSWNMSIWKKVTGAYPALRWNVTDATAPVITLLGSSSVSITKGDTYADVGATAVDDYDGDITLRIVVTNPVVTTTVGTYYIKYNVCDEEHNCAAEVSRRVDVVAPVVKTVTTHTATNTTPTPTPGEIPKVFRLSEFPLYMQGQEVSVTVSKDDSVITTISATDFTLLIADIGDNYIAVNDGNGKRTLIEVGQKKLFDLNGDGKNDLETTVTHITGSATIAFKAVLGTSEKTPSNTPTILPTAITNQHSGNWWLWIIVILIIGTSVWIYASSRKK